MKIFHLWQRGRALGYPYLALVGLLYIVMIATPFMDVAQAHQAQAPISPLGIFEASQRAVLKAGSVTERVRVNEALSFKPTRSGRAARALPWPSKITTQYWYHGSTHRPLRYIELGSQTWSTLSGRRVARTYNSATFQTIVLMNVPPQASLSRWWSRNAWWIPDGCSSVWDPVPLAVAQHSKVIVPGLPPRPIAVHLAGIRRIGGVHTWKMEVTYTPELSELPVTAQLFVSQRTRLPVLFTAVIDHHVPTSTPGGQALVHDRLSIVESFTGFHKTSGIPTRSPC